MNRQTLDKLTNLTLRVEEMDLTPDVLLQRCSKEDVAYLNMNKEQSELGLADITDFCHHWKIRGDVYFAGKKIATVDPNGDVEIL